MQNPTLKKGSDRRDDIERLQLALDELGHPVDIDAMFGPGLEREVCAFQSTVGLPVTGVADEETWAALATRSPYARPLVIDTSQLSGFAGDICWIHHWEGHGGKPYWPGGESGVTLDPGLDLGHASHRLVGEAYGSRLDNLQWAAVLRVMGKRGQDAKKALAAEADLQTIRVSRLTATEILPLVAKPYWERLCRRFVTLASPGTPATVQTAILSLGYNRGAGNGGLEPLGELLSAGDWLAVADAIGAMQQDHPLEGIRRRRRAEADLIRSAMR